MENKLTYPLSNFVFVNYFWLISITAILHVITGVGWLTTLLFPIVIFICLVRSREPISLNHIDILWICSFVWMMATWTYNSYDHKPILIFRCFISQIAYMLTYWISRRNSDDYIGSIIKNSYYPLIFVSIIGLYCFALRPSWYVNMVSMTMEATNTELSSMNLLEAFRLRSVFDSPYELAYFGAITIVFEIFLLIKSSEINVRNHVSLLLLLSVVVLCTMMRAPISCTIIGFFLSIIWGYIYLTDSKILETFLSVLVISILVILVIQQVAGDSFSYLTYKFDSVSSESSLLSDRLFLQEADYSWFGDGVGRHSIDASKFEGGAPMLDGEYMKMIQEQGFIGLFIFFLLVVFSLIKAIRHYKYLYFEFWLILMLLICMVGANALSTGDKHPFIFWLAFGQISRFVAPQEQNMEFDI